MKRLGRYVARSDKEFMCIYKDFIFTYINILYVVVFLKMYVDLHYKAPSIRCRFPFSQVFKLSHK